MGLLMHSGAQWGNESCQMKGSSQPVLPCEPQKIKCLCWPYARAEPQKQPASGTQNPVNQKRPEKNLGDKLQRVRLCGGLNEMAPYRLTGSGTIVALLE